MALDPGVIKEIEDKHALRFGRMLLLEVTRTGKYRYKTDKIQTARYHLAREMLDTEEAMS